MWVTVYVGDDFEILVILYIEKVIILSPTSCKTVTNMTVAVHSPPDATSGTSNKLYFQQYVGLITIPEF